MPHSLSALLTPTRVPHTRLLKHWKGQIVSLLALVRHPHAHSLASTLVRSHSCSRARFLLASSLARLPASCSLVLTRSRFLSGSLACFLLASLLAHFLSCFLSLERTSNSFYICGPSRRAQSPAKLTPPHLRTVTVATRTLEKGRVSASVKEMCVNVAEEKKGGHQRSRKKYVHKCVCRKEKKKASHKRGDLFFTLLNASHLKSH